MIDKRIKFEEMYQSDYYGSTTLYFLAPKEMLPYEYKAAACSEISIEYTVPETKYCRACISPVYCFDGGMSSYDWTDIDLTYEDIEELLKLAGV